MYQWVQDDPRFWPRCVRGLLRREIVNMLRVVYKQGVSHRLFLGVPCCYISHYLALVRSRDALFMTWFRYREYVGGHLNDVQLWLK